MGNPDSLAVAVCIRGLWGCCFSRQKSLCFQTKRRTPNNLVIFSIYPDPHSAICKSRLCFRLLFLPLFSFYKGLQSNRNPSLAVSRFQRTFLLLSCSERSLSPFFGICATSCHFSPGYFLFGWYFISFFCLSPPFLYFVTLSLSLVFLSPAISILNCLFSNLLEGQVQLDQAAKLALKFLWGWRVSSIPGQPTPVSDYPHHGIFLPCI